MALDTAQAVSAGLAALFVWYAVATGLAWYRLRAFRGPALASVSYLWIARATLSGRMWQVYRDASAKYGSVVRIGPNELITDDYDVIRRISGARSQYTRSSWYALNRLDPYEDSMFSLRSTVAHDKLKAKTAAAYSGKENPALEMEVDTMLVAMVDKIRTKYLPASSGGLVPLDFGRMAQYFTLDSITKIAFGEEFGFLRNEQDMHGYIKTIEDIAPFMQLSSEVPILARIASSPLVLGLAGPKLTDKKGMGRLMKFAREIVSKRFSPDATDERDMLGAFIRHGLSHRQCETEAIFQVAAGSDTTATAIRATMLYIMTTPRVRDRFLREIDEAIEGGKVSKPITSDDGEKLPYLQAVIYEGLRIHPPFVGLTLKEVPPGGDFIDGKFVPAGVRVAPSGWAMTRNKAMFGGDAELFRPERWLEAAAESEARLTEMRRTVELVFGYGRWACAGKPIAFLELNKVFVELWRNFDFQLVNPLRPWHSINHNLFIQKEMWVSVTER